MKIKKRGKERKMGLKSDKIGNGVPAYICWMNVCLNNAEIHIGKGITPKFLESTAATDGKGGHSTQ